MSSPPRFKTPGALLAHARNLILGGEAHITPASTQDRAPAPEPDAWDTAEPDKTFWVSMIASDRRLAELRRVIDQAAAEAMARGPDTEAAPSRDFHLGESRCEAANRVISAALDSEKP